MVHMSLRALGQILTSLRSLRCLTGFLHQGGDVTGAWQVLCDVNTEIFVEWSGSPWRAAWSSQPAPTHSPPALTLGDLWKKKFYILYRLLYSIFVALWIVFKCVACEWALYRVSIIILVVSPRDMWTHYKYLSYSVALCNKWQNYFQKKN